MSDRERRPRTTATRPTTRRPAGGSPSAAGSRSRCNTPTPRSSVSPSTVSTGRSGHRGANGRRRSAGERRPTHPSIDVFGGPRGSPGRRCAPVGVARPAAVGGPGVSYPTVRTTPGSWGNCRPEATRTVRVRLPFGPGPVGVAAGTPSLGERRSRGHPGSRLLGRRRPRAAARPGGRYDRLTGGRADSRSGRPPAGGLPRGQPLRNERNPELSERG